MREVIHKSGAFFLALLLLFSTLSFTLDMHFCGGSLVDYGFYHQADDCGMSMDGDAMDCCDDVELHVQGQDDLASSPDTISELPEVFFQELLYSYVVLLVEDLPESFIPFKEYSPPRLIPDISVRDQVFLI
jgi:hypothetical protein